MSSTIKKEWENKAEIQNELGFHEAGHFVLERLLLKADISDANFSGHNFIYIDSNLKEGSVNGFLQEVKWKGNCWTEKNYNLFKESIINNKRASIATLFSLIAGYTTYKKFIENTEYFIRSPNFDNDQVKYYKLDNVEHGTYRNKIDRYHWGVSDFAKIKERLGFLGVMDIVNLNKLYLSLHEKVMQIMNLGAVANSIRYIKNRLIEEDGKRIEGDNLKKHIDFVEQLMINVDVIKWIDEFEEELESI
ncbi:MAG: hypothetical protein H6559_20825 [Lewinellaceae bacterium]|nr:hypothetical protein [Lewinellaceae bacterium]